MRGDKSKSRRDKDKMKGGTGVKAEDGGSWKYLVSLNVAYVLGETGQHKVDWCNPGGSWLGLVLFWVWWCRWMECVDDNLEDLLGPKELWLTGNLNRGQAVPNLLMKKVRRVPGERSCNHYDRASPTIPQP